MKHILLSIFALLPFAVPAADLSSPERWHRRAGWRLAVHRGSDSLHGSWSLVFEHQSRGRQDAERTRRTGTCQLRPGYEIFYKYYKNTSGSYFVRKYAEVQRPECGAGDPRYGSNSGAFDQIGWGTLMLYQ
jgi:hypothetical protein